MVEIMFVVLEVHVVSLC